MATGSPTAAPTPFGRQTYRQSAPRGGTGPEFDRPDPPQRIGDRAQAPLGTGSRGVRARAVFPAAQSVAQSADLAVKINPDIGASASFYRGK